MGQSVPRREVLDQGEDAIGDGFQNQVAGEAQIADNTVAQ